MTKAEAIKVLSESIHDGSKVPWDKIVEAVHLSIEALSQPSLPSNLDEAAEKVEDYYDVGEEHGYLYCYRGDIKDAFKAGAEWMAGQGVSKKGEVFDNNEFIKFPDGTFIDLDPSQALIPAFNLNNGDKVVVQIRKK